MCGTICIGAILFCDTKSLVYHNININMHIYLNFGICLLVLDMKPKGETRTVQLVQLTASTCQGFILSLIFTVWYPLNVILEHPLFSIYTHCLPFNFSVQHFVTSRVGYKVYLELQKNLFQDVVGKEQISSVAYHSCSKRKTKMGKSSATFSTFMTWQTIQTSPTTISVSVSYCVSVLSSRDLFDVCSRNRFFCKEWSLTRQFSTRRSDTGEWSITVNFPPLKTADSDSTNEMVEGKNYDRIEGTKKDYRHGENTM